MKRALLSLFIIFVIAVTSACGGKSVRQSGDDDFGPLPPGQSAGPLGPEAPLGPLPDGNYKPPKDSIVLVLGPGLARGLAYLGVLRELEERQVMVSGVVGVEIGAVIGGIWASSNMNTLEWEMYKFKRSTLLDIPLLRFGNKGTLAEGKAIHKFLGEALKVDSLQRMRVPLLVASTVRNSQGVLVEHTGSAKDIIRGAIGIPGLLGAYPFEGHERLSAAYDSPFPVEFAKRLGLGQVVCVNTLGQGNDFSPRDNTEEQLAGLMKSAATLAREQLTQCDVVLNIPTSGISYLDFDAKADLIYKGREAVKSWLGSSP